jgi:cell division septum initiation protein DivIVA
MSTNADRYDDAYSMTGDRSEAGIERPTVRPSGADDGQDGSAAARLLEMTARETDRWRSEARTESEATVAEARKESDELVRAARAEAERLVSSAREEAAQTTNDARVEAYRVREETTALRKRHDEDIARLEKVAADTREQLREHLTEMLARVEDTPGDSSQ